MTIAPGPLLAAARSARSARRVNSPRVVAWRGAWAKPACAVTRTTVSIRCGRAIDVKRPNDKCLDVEIRARRQCDRKFISGNSTAHRVRRQRFLQPHGDGNDELVAAQDAVIVR